MSYTRISVNVDSKLKRDVEEILDKMGLNMTTAINIYLKKILMESGIPFDLTIGTSKATTATASNADL